MLFSDTIKISLKMFRIKSAQAILTIIGVSAGIGSIIFVITLGYSVQQAINEQKDLMVIVDSIKEDAQNAANPVLKQAKIKLENTDMEINVNFVKPEYLSTQGISLMGGSVFSDSEGDQNKIIISKPIFNLLNMNLDRLLGKKVIVTNRFNYQGLKNNPSPLDSSAITKLEIVGITSEDEQYNVYLPLALSGILGMMPEDPGRKNYYFSGQGDIYNQEAFLRFLQYNNKIFSISQIIFISFVALMVVVSAVRIYSILTLTLMERKKEIGIMKIFGAANTDILKIFLYEAGIIGILGGIGGVVIGMLWCAFYNYLMNILAAYIGGANNYVLYLNYQQGALIIFLALLISVLTAYKPAKKAAEIKVLDAIN